MNIFYVSPRSNLHTQRSLLKNFYHLILQFLNQIRKEWVGFNLTIQAVFIISANNIPGDADIFICLKFPLKLPYDAFNPVVKNDILKKHVCWNFRLYFGTIEGMNQHYCTCFLTDSNVSNDLVGDNTPPVSTKVNPIRILAIWQWVTLCFMHMQEME